MGNDWNTNIGLGSFRGQYQDHAHFDCEYIVIDDRYGNYYYCHRKESHVSAFDWHIYI